ncbi:MAG: DUF5684 domain-containing protein [Planctomycetota bacterium]
MSCAILLLLAQNNDAGGAIGVLIWLAIVVFLIAAWWKVYVKAGQPGWAAIIPIYNMIVLLEIVGRPWWWIFLLLIPIVGLVIYILVIVELAAVFGKGGGFAVGLIFLGFIFIPILGFGSAVYVGKRSPAAPPAMS